MSTHSYHLYHLVDYSKWPLNGAIGTLVTVTGLAKGFHQYNISLVILGNIIKILTVFKWWRDISQEGTFQGVHTHAVTIELRWGMLLFIVS